MVECRSMLNPSLAVGEVHFLGRWHWPSEGFYVKVFSVTSPFFRPLLPSLSAERRQSPAEGMPLLDGGPAGAGDGLLGSLWGGSSGGILRPLARLHAPRRGGRQDVRCCFLRTESETRVWDTSWSTGPGPDPLSQPLPLGWALFTESRSSPQKFPAFRQIRSSRRNARAGK